MSKITIVFSTRKWYIADLGDSSLLSWISLEIVECLSEFSESLFPSICKILDNNLKSRSFRTVSECV